jgi:hypothetical protein
VGEDPSGASRRGRRRRGRRRRRRRRRRQRQLGAMEAWRVEHPVADRLEG